MDLLKLLITFSVILAIYIIYSWWSRTGGLSKFSTEYHVLGCYASDTINDYSKQIKEDLDKLNSYEDKLQNVDSIDLLWLDKLLPELSKKLQIFEISYYESKADNVKSLLVEKKLEDAIKEHQQCLAKVSYSDAKDCEDVRKSQGQIKFSIDGHFNDINKLNNIKRNLEQQFQTQKLRKPAPQPHKPIVISRDEQISRQRTNLLNTRDRIRNLQKQRIILLERSQTNRDNLDRCAASRQLAKICETITATLEEFVDEQYHLASIQERIDMKTRQFKILKDAIEGCTSNCDETNREADACRQELVHLIKLQAELRQKEAKCKQLCTKQQIETLESEKRRLDDEKLRNTKSIEDANNEIKNYERKIKQLEKQTIVIPPVNEAELQPNQKLKKISDDIANVYKDIKQKHSSIQILLNTLEAKDDKFSEHARNIEILNSCAVLREVAEKLAKQVDEESRVSGSQNRIELSKGQLIRLLDTVRRSN